MRIVHAKPISDVICLFTSRRSLEIGYIGNETARSEGESTVVAGGTESAMRCIRRLLGGETMDQRPSPASRPLMAALLLGTCLSPCPVWAADFMVTNNADSGAGSLRQAIISSNTAGGSNNNIINSGVGTSR
jgi:hypothetical protein